MDENVIEILSIMQEQIDDLNERVSTLEKEIENLRFELDDVDTRTSGFARIGRP